PAPIDVVLLAIEPRDPAVGADEFELYRCAGRDLERQLTVGARPVRAEPAMLLIGGVGVSVPSLAAARPGSPARMSPLPRTLCTSIVASLSMRHAWLSVCDDLSATIVALCGGP